VYWFFASFSQSLLAMNRGTAWSRLHVVQRVQAHLTPVAVLRDPGHEVASSEQLPC